VSHRGDEFEFGDRNTRADFWMRKAVSLFTLVAAVIVASWWWLGAGIPMPPSPLDPGERLYCVSYAPFRGAQTPLDLSTKISAQQIDEDLAQLSKITDCIRIYSVDLGLDQIPEIAQRHGLKVLLGLWVSSFPDRTQYQLTTGIALANKFPDTVRAVIVGNEALLRGEVSAAKLREYIASVKSKVKAPVTYADVWEFWVRNRELASAVDFVTVHILPYWEDDPIAAAKAADHVASIRKHVAEVFPDREIVIGEFGWPSAGRMREGALPSPATQAFVLADVLRRGKQDGFRVNLIEAFDQPWKRLLEGTVGGHWGIFEDASRRQKFVWGAPVSNHPSWPWQAAGGVVFAAVVFAAAMLARRRAPDQDAPDNVAWGAIALNAAIAGVFVGWTVENIPLESLGIGGWTRSLAFAAVAVLAPVAGAVALATSRALPAFNQVIGSKPQRTSDLPALALGLLLIALVALAVQSALALSFDPRYRDFPFAPMTAAVVPFVLLSLLAQRRKGEWPLAEILAAAVLALCAVFIVWNETPANWQALWFAATLAGLVLSLLRPRAAPG
jgi:exo-beta-1,3-glucanase (GH17 family)